MVVAWENLQWVFCDVGCCSSIIAVFVMLFFIHCLSTSFLTLPWAIVRFLHPFCTFRSAHCRVICDNFILTFWILLLQFYRERYGFEWVFFTHRCFLSDASSQDFCHNLLLSRPLWELAVLPRSLQGFMLILETQTRPLCLFESQQSTEEVWW